MITRKTLKQANAEEGHFDLEKFDCLSDAAIDQMIAEARIWRRRPNRCHRCSTSGDIRRKLGLG